MDKASPTRHLRAVNAQTPKGYLWDLRELNQGHAAIALVRLSTLDKARLTPAVEDSVNQVVRDGVIFSDMLMALFALPGALMSSCYLFEYSGHYS